MNDTDRVHVSLAELRTAASRALKGAGAPPGTERDGARAAVWLESRGLRGAAALVQDLAVMASGRRRQPAFAGNRLDLAELPALIWCSTAVELAILGAGADILVEGCSIPRALLPEAAAQASEGWQFAIRSGAGEALVAGAEVSVDRSFAALGEADVLLAAAARQPSGGARAPAPTRFTSSGLEARHAASLANGLRLIPREWRVIREAAARILVPASERSRSRGAGAEVDDNE